MLLAIDAGNTNIVFALIGKGGEVRARCRISTDAKRTGDELALQFLQFLQLQNIKMEEISRVIISCVVPQLMFALTSFSKNYCKLEPMIVHLKRLKLGVQALVDSPHEVGADRLVNTVAAFHLVKAPVIVVDFGTATTFDVVNADGNYCGGVIAPGINLSLDALQKAAARLPEVEITKPESVIGTNTVRCMQSGVFYGYLGLIEGILTRMKGELPHPVKVLATGGLSSLYGKATSMIDRVELDLTLHGLYLIAQRNV